MVHDGICRNATETKAEIYRLCFRRCFLQNRQEFDSALLNLRLGAPDCFFREIWADHAYPSHCRFCFQNLIEGAVERRESFVEVMFFIEFRSCPEDPDLLSGIDTALIGNSLVVGIHVMDV